MDRKEVRLEDTMVKRVEIEPVDGFRWQRLIAILFLSERLVQASARVESGPVRAMDCQLARPSTSLETYFGALSGTLALALGAFLCLPSILTVSRTV